MLNNSKDYKIITELELKPGELYNACKLHYVKTYENKPQIYFRKTMGFLEEPIDDINYNSRFSVCQNDILMFLEKKEVKEINKQKYINCLIKYGVISRPIECNFSNWFYYKFLLKHNIVNIFGVSIFSEFSELSYLPTISSVLLGIKEIQ